MDEMNERLKKALQEHDRFFITGAQQGDSHRGKYSTKPNTQFLDSINMFCDDIGAVPIIQPIHPGYMDERGLHEAFDDYVIGNDFKINSNVRVVDFNVKPQQINPLTGLARFAQGDDGATSIFASPKQQFRVVPNSVTKLPRMTMTTGAVTERKTRNMRKYPTEEGESRRGRIAKLDHKWGGILVERQNNKKFHVRKITSQANGKFYDLCKRYDPHTGVITPERPEALVLGDWHNGQTDPKVRKATFELIERFEPKRIILHDFFDGYTISHHLEKKLLTSAYEYDRNGRKNLEDELKDAARELERFVAMTDKAQTEIVMVRSNHDEFLHRYLDEGRFMKTSPHNKRLGLELALGMIDGKDPIEEGIRKFYKGTIPQRVKFLEREEDYKVKGVQLGAHGDKGVHGARSNVNALEHAYGKSITGHTHMPAIFRDVYVVGTSTPLQMGYNDGLSGWMNTHAFLYADGNVQLINIIDGKYEMN